MASDDEDLPPRPDPPTPDPPERPVENGAGAPSDDQYLEPLLSDVSVTRRTGEQLKLSGIQSNFVGWNSHGVILSALLFLKCLCRFYSDSFLFWYV